MHFTEPVYRHHLEMDTPLLQITAGCSHNRCSFCTIYKDVKFEINSMAHIEEDIQELRQTYPRLKRIFLVNGDPLALPTHKLEQILKKITEAFPEMKTISTHASVRNLCGKKKDELMRLKGLRLNDLYIGLDSGHDDALAVMNKGYTADQALNRLTMLKKVDIRYRALILLGAAGKGNGTVNARDTASLLNATSPEVVSVLPLGIFPDSRLETLYKQGSFTPPTEREMIEEEIELLQLLDLEDTLFYGGHKNNLVTISGRLPDEKQTMLGKLDSALTTIPHETLNAFANRQTL